MLVFSDFTCEVCIPIASEYLEDHPKTSLPEVFATMSVSTEFTLSSAMHPLG